MSLIARSAGEGGEWTEWAVGWAAGRLLRENQPADERRELNHRRRVAEAKRRTAAAASRHPHGRGTLRDTGSVQ